MSATFCFHRAGALRKSGPGGDLTAIKNKKATKVFLFKEKCLRGFGLFYRIFLLVFRTAF